MLRPFTSHRIQAKWIVARFEQDIENEQRIAAINARNKRRLAGRKA